MRSTPELDARTGLEKLATYPYQILSWVDFAGYPVSVAVDARIDLAGRAIRFEAPAGLVVPTDRDVSLTGSHIRPQPGYGYDERRHVTVWGPASIDGGTVKVEGRSAWGWDEAEVPFFEYSERSIGKSRKYFDALSAERGTPVKPRLTLGFLTLRTTRLPFLTATIVPVALGIFIAASDGRFDLVAALLTIIGASFVQLGLNVANDVFDTIQGADDANVTPTQFSGGSRVIQYGLVTLRQMATLSTVFYVLAGVIGLILLATHGSTALLVIGVVGFVVSLGYTAPPLKFVYRRPRRDRGRGRVRAADATWRVRGPDRRRAGLGAGRGIDPGGAARGADPVRQRDPRPARRRPSRQADPAGSLLEGRRHRRLQPGGRGSLRRAVDRRGGRRPAGPGTAHAAHDPAGGPRVSAASLPTTTTPTR